uniref:Uncharacterized protein n=1 Tax=Arundo donax TaxID=35708 RepID=A0A0A9FC07_ARUDO
MQQPNKIQVLRIATVQIMLDFHTKVELRGNIFHVLMEGCNSLSGTRRVHPICQSQICEGYIICVLHY